MLNYKIALKYINTVRYLKFSQIINRLSRPVKNIFSKNQKYSKINFTKLPNIYLLQNNLRLKINFNYLEQDNIFTFLNVKINTKGNWFPNSASILWIYNLHYFDWLFELNNVNSYTTYIENWIEKNYPNTKHSWHPYTTSLRICNWIWSYSSLRNNFKNDFLLLFFNSIYNQTLFVNDHLEFDVLGNHLIENCKALIISGVFFNNKKWIEKGAKILDKELQKQILNDGGHYERSPMYHCIVLTDLIVIYDALICVENHFCKSLKLYIIKMYEFLKKITNNNKIPLFNDSANDIAYNPNDILKEIENKFGEDLTNVTKNSSILLKDSGYFLYNTKFINFTFDCGKLGPDFLLAHAHNDMLSYTLQLNEEDIVTDSGTYEYTAGKWRNYFRSTKAHSTITINNAEQNEIWSSFRVAQRGYPHSFKYSDDKLWIKGGSTCYHSLGVDIVRFVQILPKQIGIIVIDYLTSEKKVQYDNYIQLAPNIKNVKVSSLSNSNYKTLQLITSNKKNYILYYSSKYNIHKETGWESKTFGIKKVRIKLRLNSDLNKGNNIFSYAIIAGSENKDYIELLNKTLIEKQFLNLDYFE